MAYEEQAVGSGEEGEPKQSFELLSTDQFLKEADLKGSYITGKQIFEKLKALYPDRLADRADLEYVQANQDDFSGSHWRGPTLFFFGTTDDNAESVVALEWVSQERKFESTGKMLNPKWLHARVIVLKASDQ